MLYFIDYFIASDCLDSYLLGSVFLQILPSLSEKKYE